ncbi:hypothetical protein QPK87_19320 [Kamptonema cortianum]|nr:hypothetical protein [Geitlerinema splendidum]MDK3158707.1 hypothetical protein [Kamptonema cortianum]
MVHATNFTMVSTLVGLRRLEAQIERALLNADKPGDQPPQSQATQQLNRQIDASKTIAEANVLLSRLDMHV